MIPWLYTLTCALCAVLASRVAMQYFQLESYQLGGYFRTLRRAWARAVWPGAAVAAAGILVTSIFWNLAPAADWPLPAGALVQLAAAVAAWLAQRRLPAKRPLVFTPRVRRLITAQLVLALVVCALLALGLRVPGAAMLVPAAAALLLVPSALLVSPVERLINRLYLRDAMKRLDAMPGLIKIGITGSYGKTSTKFMLDTILSQKYRVLATQGSFNTSMGVTRVIRERLSPDHQVFIAEMGARHMGDIALLCKLVRPRYGILTSVGPQHLETFRSLDNIAREKNRLAEAIPPDGAIVFAGDDGGPCDALYDRATAPRHRSGSAPRGLGLTARDIQVGPWGSRFTLVGGAEEIPCQTRLLGRHSISNLLAACTLARVLGLSMQEIARGVASVAPVEHRLELLRGTGPYTVIDDAFNANPRGAQEALRVLRDFPGRRIIVTPGFVELGAEEDAYNRAFGEQMAQCVDIAILVGRRHTGPIAQGLAAGGFPEGSLHIVATLAEATALLARIRQPGDVELYENDLPDNYQE